MAYGGGSSSIVLFLILILLVFGMGFYGYSAADVKE